MINKSSFDLSPASGEIQNPEAIFSENPQEQKKGRRQTIDLIKRAIWIYFLLLIFEGALRKWVLPGLSSPLLLIRDPVAVWILITAYNKGLFPSNIYVKGAIFVGVIGIFTSVLFGHGSFPVALFGARAFLIHIPLVFVIGKTFDRGDVISIGKVLLMISIPMAVLVAAQFYSPQTALVNKGVGDAEFGGFSGALGYSRPPGTFSFTSGLTAFYGFVSCFVFYFWLNPKTINRLILIGATGALLIVIPLSISRSLFFSIGVVFVFVILASLRKPEYLLKMVLSGFIILIILAVANQFSFFQTGIEVFTARFENANAVEGGVEDVLLDRYLGGLFSAISFKAQVPIFGYGLGRYSNVGSTLLSGKIVSGIAEGEWGRIIAESGPILGLLTVFARIGLSIKFSLLSLRKLGQGDLLPWLLLSFCLLTFPQGNWAQPTSLGFCVILPGLLLASLRKRITEVEFSSPSNLIAENSQT